MKNKILELAKTIACQSFKNCQEEYDLLIKAENVLMEHLKMNIHDTEAWLLLARIECNSLCDDYDRITHYAGHVLSYDPSNSFALLFLAYADYYLHGTIKADTYSKLCFAKSDDPEFLAMIELAKARYFETFDQEKYKQALEKSVKYSDKQQHNCSELGIIYLKQGKRDAGISLIKKAIKNTKVSDYWNAVDMECWLNYYYKGTQITQEQYDHLMSLCN